MVAARARHRWLSQRPARNGLAAELSVVAVGLASGDHDACKPKNG